MERLGRGVLISFLMLFAALYAGFGVQSPYLPALLKDHGLAAEAIGVVLASGTAIRLAAGPLAGRPTVPRRGKRAGADVPAKLPANLRNPITGGI